MKRVINLHPTDNGAEAVLATIQFRNRMISLGLDFPSYGQFGGNFTVNFNQVKDLRYLIDQLLDVAEEADNYFAKNP